MLETCYALSHGVIKYTACLYPVHLGELFEAIINDGFGQLRCQAPDSYLIGLIQAILENYSQDRVYWQII